MVYNSKYNAEDNMTNCKRRSLSENRVGNVVESEANMNKVQYEL
jgi:hypothetical protein